MLDLVLAEQDLKAFQERLKDLAEALHLDHLRLKVSELEAMSGESELWQDPVRAQRVQQDLKHNQAKLAAFEKLQSGLEDCRALHEMLAEGGEDAALEAEFVEETKALDQALEALRLETYFTGPYDANNAILSLHAGAGGTEAQDWTEMLYRMYTRWAERHDFEVKTLDYADGEEAGLKSVSFQVNGPNAYGLLRSEMGVHRLVRISPFDTSGRRHTSFASVEVMPELDQSIEIAIRPEDLRVDYYRSSGAGGQHVNKTSSAVRLTHLPTGVVVACQNERSQVQNKEVAMNMLRSKLFTLARKAQKEHIEDLKGEQLDNAFGSQIRSYVFCPYTLVKDNRSNYQSADVEAVMDGELDPFIQAYLALEVKGKLEEV